MATSNIASASRSLRRPFLAGALAMVLTCLGVLAYDLGQERPHLVLIVVDSLRADARSDSIGAAATPYLDHLAKEGLVFHEAFAHSPSSLPGLVSLLSARHPGEARVTADGRAVPEDVSLLAEHLARRGYQTRASIGSAAVRPPAPGLGLDRGFTRFDPGGVATAEEGSRRAIGALDGLDPREPFFLLAHIAHPHGPPGDQDAEGEASEARSSFMELREDYKRAVEALDRAVGAILVELHRRGLYERSLIVVTSNHGLALGEHGLVGSDVALYDALLRVPLIVRLPYGAQHEPLARWRHRLVRHVDVAPTLLALLGLPALPGATGTSLLEPTERVLLAEAHPPAAPRALLALRDGQYKLVLDATSNEHSLFRLSNDPLELDDVFSYQGHLRLEWQRELERLAGPRER